MLTCKRGPPLTRRLAAPHRPVTGQSFFACRPRVAVTRATQKQDDKEAASKAAKDLVENMKKTGLTKEQAQDVLKRWNKEVGHEITNDDIRKLLVKQTALFSGFVFVQLVVELGAAYGAFVAGNFFGVASLEYGTWAVVGQAVAYLLAGYYAAGVFFDLFKLGALSVAAFQFNVNSASFLAAVQEIAGPSGLATVDKAQDAVNSVRVLSGLSKMADLLRDKAKAGNTDNDMLTDLAAFVTLDNAQKRYGFDAATYGLNDAEAACIAVAFSRYDANDDGVLNSDEFRKLCAEFDPELTSDEAAAAFRVIDTDASGTIDFVEFVKWWIKKD